MGSKWQELLTQIAPGVKRVAAMFNPDTAPFITSYFLPSFEAAARSLKMEPIAVRVHSDSEIEMAITSLGRESGSGLVIMGDLFTRVHRESIILAAAQNNVPTIY
jgi:putative ABC transport system substrate-binding protein